LKNKIDYDYDNDNDNAHAHGSCSGLSIFNEQDIDFVIPGIDHFEVL